MEQGKLQADPHASQHILEKFTSLDSSDANTDFAIKCRDLRWSVHKFVLRLHSKPLGNACSGAFKEACKAEYDLSEHEEECVEALVSYLYKLNYDDAPFITRERLPLTTHTKICILANKYAILPLQDLATRKFNAELGSGAVLNLNDLADAAAVAYEAMDPTTDIRAAIVDRAIKDKLLSSQHDMNAFESLARTCPDLSTDIIQAMLRVDSSETQTRVCAHCTKSMTIRHRIDAIQNCGVTSRTVQVKCGACNLVSNLAI